MSAADARSEPSPLEALRSLMMEAGFADRIAGVATFCPIRDCGGELVADGSRDGFHCSEGHNAREVAAAVCVELDVEDVELKGRQLSDAIPSPPEQSIASGRIPQSWLGAGSVREWFGAHGLRTPAPRRFVFEDLLPAGVVGLLAGEGGVGKGRMALSMCIAGTTGRAFGPFRVPARVPATWVYVGKEDDRDEQHRRLHAALRAFPDLTAEELESLQHHLVIPPPLAGLKLGPDLVDALGDFSVKTKASVILIDPLTRFWDEEAQVTVNSQEGAGWAHNWLGAIQQATGATVLAIHHANQRGRQQVAAGGELNATQITGSVQLVDLARWVLQLGPVGEEKARSLGLKGRQLIEANITKSNYTARPRPWIFELTAGGAVMMATVPQVLTTDMIMLEQMLAEQIDGITRDQLIKAAKEMYEIPRERSRAAIRTLLSTGGAHYCGDRRRPGSYRLFSGHSGPPAAAGSD